MDNVGDKDEKGDQLQRKGTRPFRRARVAIAKQFDGGKICLGSHAARLHELKRDATDQVNVQRRVVGVEVDEEHASLTVDKADGWMDEELRMSEGW